MKFRMMENVGPVEWWDKNLGVLEQLKMAIAKSNFRQLWKENDKEGLFELCNKIREKTGAPPYSYEKFDDGWQYRRVLADKLKDAKNEFLNLVFGWW
jgi:hypothetical protein